MNKQPKNPFHPYLLDSLGHWNATKLLRECVSRCYPLPWVKREPWQAADPDFASKPDGMEPPVRCNRAATVTSMSAPPWS